MARPRTATVYENGPVRVVPRGARYLVRWQERGIQHERSATSLPDAQALADTTAARLAVGVADHSKATIGDVVAAYLATDRPGWSPAMRAQVTSLLAVHVTERLGTVRASTVTPAHFARIAREMHAAGYPPTTITHVLKAARSVVRWGAQQGVWQGEPLLVGLDLPDAIRQAQRARAVLDGPTFSVPTRDSAVAFCAALGDLHAPYGLLARLILTSGLRMGEATALLAADVDVERRRVQVTKAYNEVDGVLELRGPKSARGVRWAPIFDDAVAADLAQYLATHPGGDVPLFHTRRGAPLPLRRSNFRTRYVVPAKAASGYAFGMHGLRHRAISDWVDAGHPVATVSRMAGHHSESFTLDRYYGAAADHLDVALRRERDLRAR